MEALTPPYPFPFLNKRILIVCAKQTILSPLTELNLKNSQLAELFSGESMSNSRLFYIPAFTGLLLFLLTPPQLAFAREQACALPYDFHEADSKLSRKTRKACIMQAQFFSSQPDLTAEQLREGPRKIQGAFAEGLFHCRFVFKSKANETPQFLCYHTNEKFQYLMRHNHLLADEALTVDSQDFLLDARGHRIYAQEDGRPIKADLLRIKYNGGRSNHREVYTELAASRLYWALGIYVDEYDSSDVSCFGCELDPYRSGQSTPSQGLANFSQVSVQRSLAAKSLGSKGWSCAATPGI